VKKYVPTLYRARNKLTFHKHPQLQTNPMELMHHQARDIGRPIQNIKLLVMQKFTFEPELICSCLKKKSKNSKTYKKWIFDNEHETCSNCMPHFLREMTCLMVCAKKQNLVLFKASRFAVYITRIFFSQTTTYDFSRRILACS
jgi:hypothetical protein